jgi:hypothetical protein
VVATSDGKLIAAGTDQSGSDAGGGLFEFKQSDGTLETTFGGGSGQERVTLPGGDAGTATALALDPSRRLLVAGQDTTKSHTFVARLSAAGAPDSSFGSGGFSIPTIGTSDGAQGVSVDTAGNPVVAGFGTPSGASDTDVLTARLLGATPPPSTTTSGSSGTGGSTPTPTGDSTPTPSQSPTLTPTLSHLSQSRSRWREGNAQARLARATPRKRRGSSPPVGTTFSFALNEPATISFSFARQLTGRRVNRRCAAPTKHNRNKHRCNRTLPQGMLILPGHAGLNKVTFQGRLSPGSELPLGRYTLTVAAIAPGNRSPSRSLNFTIVS